MSLSSTQPLDTTSTSTYEAISPSPLKTLLIASQTFFADDTVRKYLNDHLFQFTSKEPGSFQARTCIRQPSVKMQNIVFDLFKINQEETKEISPKLTPLPRSFVKQLQELVDNQRSDIDLSHDYLKLAHLISFNPQSLSKEHLAFVCYIQIAIDLLSQWRSISPKIKHGQTVKPPTPDIRQMLILLNQHQEVTLNDQLSQLANYLGSDESILAHLESIRNISHSWSSTPVPKVNLTESHHGMQKLLSKAIAIIIPGCSLHLSTVEHELSELAEIVQSINKNRSFFAFAQKHTTIKCPEQMTQSQEYIIPWHHAMKTLKKAINDNMIALRRFLEHSSQLTGQATRVPLISDLLLLMSRCNAKWHLFQTSFKSHTRQFSTRCGILPIVSKAITHPTDIHLEAFRQLIMNYELFFQTLSSTLKESPISKHYQPTTDIFTFFGELLNFIAAHNPWNIDVDRSYSKTFLGDQAPKLVEIVKQCYENMFHKLQKEWGELLQGIPLVHFINDEILKQFIVSSMNVGFEIYLAQVELTSPWQLDTALKQISKVLSEHREDREHFIQIANRYAIYMNQKEGSLSFDGHFRSYEYWAKFSQYQQMNEALAQTMITFTNIFTSIWENQSDSLLALSETVLTGLSEGEIKTFLDKETALSPKTTQVKASSSRIKRRKPNKISVSQPKKGPVTFTSTIGPVVAKTSSLLKPSLLTPIWQSLIRGHRLDPSSAPIQALDQLKDPIAQAHSDQLFHHVMLELCLEATTKLPTELRMEGELKKVSQTAWHFFHNLLFHMYQSVERAFTAERLAKYPNLPLFHRLTQLGLTSERALIRLDRYGLAHRYGEPIASVSLRQSLPKLLLDYIAVMQQTQPKFIREQFETDFKTLRDRLGNVNSSSTSTTEPMASLSPSLSTRLDHCDQIVMRLIGRLQKAHQAAKKGSMDATLIKIVLTHIENLKSVFDLKHLAANPRFAIILGFMKTLAVKYALIHLGLILMHRSGIANPKLVLNRKVHDLTVYCEDYGLSTNEQQLALIKSLNWKPDTPFQSMARVASATPSMSLINDLYCCAIDTFTNEELRPLHGLDFTKIQLRLISSTENEIELLKQLLETHL